MFFKAKIKKIGDGTVDIQPLLEDRNGKYSVVKGVSIFQNGGGGVSINYSYAVDDVVIVALTGYPTKSNMFQNEDLFCGQNWKNAVVMGKLYEGSIDEDSLILDSTDKKINIKNNKRNLLDLLLEITGQMKLNKTPTAIGPQVITPADVQEIIQIEKRIKELLI